MTMAELRKYRAVPAKRGMRVKVDGKMGRITGNYGDSIRVRFDESNWIQQCHPWWRVVYYGPDGVTPIHTRADEFGRVEGPYKPITVTP
jgi:hypothetical protein